jgi:hypothetical protein
MGGSAVKRKALLWPRVVLTAGVLAGCNMLAFTAGDDDDSYVVKGQDNLRAGNFDQAVEYFSKALARNPRNAEARWGRAKAYVRGTGENSIELMSELSDFRGSNGALLPFMDEGAWPDLTASGLLRAVQLAKTDLQAIYDGEASSPELNRETIGLDYAASLSIAALLNVRDVNRDGRITSDERNVFLATSDSAGVAFGGDWSALTPEERNDVAVSVKELVDAGADALAVVLSDVLESKVDSATDFTPEQRQEIKDSLGFDAVNIDGLIDQINAALDEAIQP